MNGFIEPLPGLLDDPLFQIPNLPTLPDVHIAPLRNPAPLRHVNAPLPLEPLTNSFEDGRHSARTTAQTGVEPDNESSPRLRPSDVLSAREAKKPHLAISELLETTNDVDTQSLQLPSFVSLAVVERSPIQEPTLLSPHKRLRLDLDVDIPSRDVGRRLPRPAQKDEKQQRPVPLLPAMVTGLHEPPPSAGILPSMDLDGRPRTVRSSKSSKMQVKDMLTEPKQPPTHVPPEAMLNTPDLLPAQLPKLTGADSSQPSGNLSMTGNSDLYLDSHKKDQKTRRARRKWTDEETADLIAGIKKHGFGKWKQILTDNAYLFHDRTSIDLKDRYRTYSKDLPDTQLYAAQSHDPQSSTSHSHGDETSRATDVVAPSTSQSEAVKPKRKRRPWTAAEDAALLHGVSKHGFQWTNIHDDAELNLNHRRATDLRDRIRNLYPEGYKQAEVRPLKSDIKKEEKSLRVQETSSSELQASLKSTDERSSKSTPQDLASGAISSLHSKQIFKRGNTVKTGVPVQQTVEQVGVTLPSLALDDDDELDWGNNTLPPLLEWEEIGM